MAARHASQERRAADRKKRRAAKPEAEETQTEALPSETADAIWEAASAAVVGAAVGAAQALARKREEERAEAEPEAADVQEEPEPEGMEAAEREPEPPAPESEAEAEEPAAAPPPEPQEPGRPGDAPKMVKRARSMLRDLRGIDAESVSAVARTASGWRIGLEVVELQRIPPSTDVLATYQIELDADGELLTLDRARRYYRSEADKG